MTQRERFFKALQGEKTDRVPVSFYTHLSVGDDNGVSVNVNWVCSTGTDMIAIEPDGFYNLHWDKPLKTLAEFKALRPYKREDHFIAAQVDRASRVAEALGRGGGGGIRRAVISIAFPDRSCRMENTAAFLESRIDRRGRL